MSRYNFKSFNANSTTPKSLSLWERWQPQADGEGFRLCALSVTFGDSSPDGSAFEFIYLFECFSYLFLKY